ncbi:MAG: metallophosphoesterase family protein [Kouleothrix sp.]|nr:metallophosphoesterase family protein [Kouleothrix sp.]
MRIVVISDIHGNCVALDAVLRDLQGQAADQIVCLGDAVQGGPQPAQVVGQLRALRCPVVLGNADAWLLSGAETGAEAISSERLRAMHDVRAWALAQLSAEDQAFIAAFPRIIELDLGEGGTLLAYHGSPQSFDDIILPDTPQEQLAAFLQGHTADLYCGGHTHVQFVRRIGPGPQIHFNPGSVGLAYSHHQPEEDFRADRWAEYAVLTVDGGRVQLEFRRVPYDVAPLLDAYARSGRPHASSAIAQYQRPLETHQR